PSPQYQSRYVASRTPRGRIFFVAKRSISSLKRVRQNARRRQRNQARRSALKSQIRRFTDALAGSSADMMLKEYKSAGVLLDRAASHGIIHKNTAARKKSRLARRLNASKAGKK